MCRILLLGDYMKKPSIRKYEYVVVGTGPGGATIAKELANAKKSVAILEYGSRYTSASLIKALGKVFLDKKIGLVTTTGDISIGRSRILGGSSYFAQGNAVTPPKKIFKEWGIDLSKECASARDDLRVNLMPEDLIGPGTRRIIEGAKSLGYEMKPTPKSVDYTKCNRCGKCATGCPTNAKWTALEFVDEAVANDADLFLNAEVTRIKKGSGGFSVITYKEKGSLKEIISDKVIL